MKHVFPVLICAAAILGCQAKKCPMPNYSEKSARCAAPEAAKDMVYETWTPKDAHVFVGGLTFDVGDADGAKYLERKSNAQWLAPETISAETAQKENLPWAADRNVRWLASTAGTLHFPLYPDEWDGDLYVETGLRPKNNASMAVRFYKPDGNGGRTWSEPLTADLTPGYNGYRWKIPKPYLAKDGMQLMRVSFPGSFFEGENRVAAKFVHFAIRQGDLKAGKFKLEPKKALPETYRVLDQSLNGFGLNARDHIERYFVVPDDSALEFYAAPGAWSDAPGKITVAIQDDKEKKVATEIAITPGECWKKQRIDLKEYAGEAVRAVISYDSDANEGLFAQANDFRPEVYIGAPQIVVNGDALAQAKAQFTNPKRVVILAVDNLRADRILNDGKRRATTHLSRLADSGIAGAVMGEAKSFVAMETSFLTGVPAAEHNVIEPGIHVRKSLTTIAEAASPQGWKSHFYSTSAIVDTTRGFAQGFDEIRALNKENITGTRAALGEVANDIARAPEKSLFYVHLSELRLPHRASADTINRYAVPGYAGPVNDAAMNNFEVMRNPGREDAEQFEAYYDAELHEIDENIGDFASKLPNDTLLFIYGTHGCSLGESTLGYELGLTPWELMTPYLFYMPEKSVGVKRPGIATASELSNTVKSLIGIESGETVFSMHQARPAAEGDGMAATASEKYFYRVKRDGVYSVFTTGLDGTKAQKLETSRPILEQALREQID